jgi:cytochrome b involved in lipid metabolism
MGRAFTTQDVAAHNKPNDLYIIVDEDVYDLTQFQDEHPGTPSLSLPSALTHKQFHKVRKETHHSAGGKKILTRVAGKDASKQFWKYHNDGILKKYKSKLLVGSLNTKAAAEPAPAPVKEEKKELVKPKAESGAVVPVPAVEEVETLEPFGDLIPFADPSWYQGVCFPLLSVPHSLMKLGWRCRGQAPSKAPS